MKNFLCIIFISILLLSTLISCDSKQTEIPESSPKDTAEQEITEPASEGRLPFEPAITDLGGRAFTFADCGWAGHTAYEQRDVLAEEENGDGVNDAVYRRNMIIMDMFNCTIAEQKYNESSALLAGIKKSVDSGDGQFDAAYIRFGPNLNALSTGNYLHDLTRTANIDLTRPWWDQNCIAQTSIAGRLFAVAGDIEILDKGAINAFVFNKQLWVNYQIENLYSLVKEGKWTLDKLLELSKQISEDLDGNGQMDENDRYGLLYYRDSIPAFLTGTDEYIAKKDENDLPYMSFNSEKLYNSLEAIYDVIYDENVAFHSMRAFGDAGFEAGGVKMFQDAQVLLMYIRMTEIEPLRGMETDFGILPFPKYDENQKNYMSLVNAVVGSALAIPSTADPDISGAVLEAMAYESRYTLLPAYYDVMLKTKISRDSDSEEMLNIIFGNKTYDLGGIYAFGGIETELMYHTVDLKRTMASFYEKNEAKAERDIEKLIASFSAMD